MQRSEYLDQASEDKTAHSRYYGQFVDEAVKAVLLRYIKRSEIVASEDRHFNDIALKRWDALMPLLPASARAKLRPLGEVYSLGSTVCIYKEAARQIKAEAENKP